MDTPCVIGIGWRDKDGYVITKHQGKDVRAHRLAYAKAKGLPLEALKGILIRHKCDNPPCCNVEHLEPGTDADNVADREARGRGRQPKGSKQASAKLTETDIPVIRAKLQAGLTLQAIANQFNVSKKTILRVKQGTSWSHV